MRIANNLPALTAYKELNATNNALTKSVQSLTSGLRINSAADDAAGFAISQRMRSQISGLDRAIQSTQDGISLLQTAEGAISQTNSMLMRMRELAVQASNDSLTSQDRQFLQLEIDELRDQINNIANTTQFNNKRILDGSSGAMWSSTDLSLKATINKGLISVDEFGQKVNHEGNYKIQIEAEPGEGQVQKSNIMNVARTEFETTTAASTKKTVETVRTFTEKVVITTEEKEISIILDGGDNGEAISNVKEATNLDEITSGWNFNASNSELNITEDGVYRIVGTDSMKSTRNHITIAEGVKAQIILDGVNIDTSSIANTSAFEVKQGAKAEIFLANTNRLKSSQGRAGIEVTGSVNGSGSNAEVVINSASSTANSLEGVLEVTGGHNAAAIGGPGSPAATNGKSGNITINGGTIIANGGTNAAGIGGGYASGYNGGGTININGGDVTAISPLDAGIGTGLCGISDSGHDNDGTVINITGGKVKAKGGSGSGAGIGGGLNFWSGEINIKSGITIIEDSPASSNTAFLEKAKQHTENNTGNFVYAVQGSTSTTAIGHGASAGDTPNGINLNANLPNPDFPDVLNNPKAMVEQQSIILEEHVEYITTSEETTSEEINKEVTTNLTLDEISQFHTEGGASIVNPYQNIKIIQGNGKTAEVTIYSNDTMYSVAEKINDAIANSLGQALYTDVNNKFCTISDGTANTSESVYSVNPIYDDELFRKDANNNYILDSDGKRIPRSTEEHYRGNDIYATMLVRSAIPGKDGELYFSGDNDLLQALGLNTIRASSESEFTASVYNAHTGQSIAQNVKATESSFVGLLPPDIDISVDPMAGISASWDDTTKRFIWARKENYEAMIHLKNNGISFQTGANNGEDFMIDLGDMTSEALDLLGVNLTTRESASRSIGLIDKAINKVSSQRAKIGAYENALENTMNNLKTTSLNITAAESRIRDADMAQEMMNFVKYQILNQSGTSMLAQANQMPSSVQSLFQ